MDPHRFPLPSDHLSLRVFYEPTNDDAVPTIHDLRAFLGLRDKLDHLSAFILPAQTHSHRVQCPAKQELGEEEAGSHTMLKKANILQCYGWVPGR